MDREAIGSYRLVRLLGKGGMGAVFEAVHQTIERRAAIKILHPEFTSNPEYAERFLNEARAANRISHPSIVEIYDLGSLPDGTTYLVMEFLDGETLGKRLHRQGGSLPLADLLWIGQAIASAVSAAHLKGIIHRDLKPDNVMVITDEESRRGERVKLLDFGIAKLSVAGAHNPGATQIGTVMGTLAYMSPEQLRDTACVTDRADVYSLGALLYQLVSGGPPFVATNDIELMAMHLRDPAVALRLVAPQTPEPLAQLIDQMLAKDPLQRPAMTEVDSRLLALRRTCESQVSGPLPPITPELPAAKVPATIVRLTPGSRRVPLSGSQPLPPAEPEAAPSSSTLSGSASEAEAAVVNGRVRNRIAFLLACAGVPVLVVMLLTTLQRRHPVVPASSQPRLNPGPAPWVAPPAAPDGDRTAGLVGSLPAPVSPSPVAPLAATNPPLTGPAPGAAEATTPALHKPVATRACQRTQIVPACIPVALSQGRLSPGLVELAVRAGQIAELRPCAGQTLRAVREGKKMLFEPSYLVPAEKAKLFSETLRGLLPPGRTLPSEVLFRCGK